MSFRAKIMAFAALVLIFDLPAAVACGGAEPPFYDLMVRPMVISPNGSVSIDFTITGTNASRARYVFTVILPDSAKAANAIEVVLDGRGSGYGSMTYPTDFGTAAITAQMGVYVVYVATPSEPDVRLASSSFEVTQ